MSELNPAMFDETGLFMTLARASVDLAADLDKALTVCANVANQPPGERPLILMDPTTGFEVTLESGTVPGITTDAILNAARGAVYEAALTLIGVVNQMAAEDLTQRESAATGDIAEQAGVVPEELPG